MIPNPELKREVEMMLNSAGKFAVTMPRKIGGEFDQLGAVTQAFLDQYPHIQSIAGGMELGRDLVEKSSYIEGFLSIGHSEDWDIVQRPGDDRVFVVEGSEKSMTDIEVEYQNVYEFILREFGSER